MIANVAYGNILSTWHTTVENTGHTKSRQEAYPFADICCIRDIEGLCKWRLLVCLHCGCPGHSYSAPDWFCISSRYTEHIHIYIHIYIGLGLCDLVFRMLTCTMKPLRVAGKLTSKTLYILWTRTLATETGNQLWSPNHFVPLLRVDFGVIINEWIAIMGRGRFWKGREIQGFWGTEVPQRQWWLLVLGGTNNFVPRHVPWKSTTILSSTVVTVAQ